MGDWTTDRVLMAPVRAADLLNEADERATIVNTRINDLLDANNRYQQEARDARAVARELDLEVHILRAALARQ